MVSRVLLSGEKSSSLWWVEFFSMVGRVLLYGEWSFFSRVSGVLLSGE